MQLKVNGIFEGDNIPKEHTCVGNNVSPKIEWWEAPEGVESFVLIVDDPDAPLRDWVHWVLYNIPANKNGMPEGVMPLSQLEDGILQGINDFKKTGYDGPCPPPGHGPHRYFFRLYALDIKLELSSGASKIQVEQAMYGHVLAVSEFIGRFERK